jgi:hypothetical protein
VDPVQLLLKYLKDIGIDAKPIQQEYGAYIATTVYGKLAYDLRRGRRRGPAPHHRSAPSPSYAAYLYESASVG